MRSLWFHLVRVFGGKEQMAEFEVRGCFGD